MEGQLSLRWPQQRRIRPYRLPFLGVVTSKLSGCRVTRFLSIVSFFFTLICWQAAAWAQETRAEPASGENSTQESSSDGLPQVSLSDIVGSPGSSVMIPLYYTPDPNTPLRSLTVEIDYVSNNLIFQKASPGTVTEQAGADVQTALTDGSPDEKNVVRSRLRLAFSLPEEQPPKGLPEGLLAYLLFRISTEAKPFAIRLNTSVISAEDIRNPSQEAKVNAQPGMIVVEIPDMMPEATCFFFSH